MNMTTRARLRALRMVVLGVLFIPLSPVAGLIFALMFLWKCVIDVFDPWEA